jgi:hypothetical protein
MFYLYIFCFTQKKMHTGLTENGIWNYRLLKWRPVKKHHKQSMLNLSSHTDVVGDEAINQLYYVIRQICQSNGIELMVYQEISDCKNR